MKISIREFVRWQAILDLFRTLFVVLLFYIAIYFFMYDATRLVIDPLERLLKQVKEMSQNPAKALKLAEKREKMRSKETKKSDLDFIQETISKLAYLLVLGFGRAGDSVISKILYSKNMNLEIKPMVSDIYGIFGFCDIRNFTDVTEVLGTEVIRFVNTVGDIVHKVVDKYKGGANKNIGDAFLLVWKLSGRYDSDIATFTKEVMSEERKAEVWAQYDLLRNYEKRDRHVQRSNTSQDEGFAGGSRVNDNEIHRKPTPGSTSGLERHKSGLDSLKHLNLAAVEALSTKYSNNLKNSTLAELSLISFLKCIDGVSTDPRITKKYNRHKAINAKIPNYHVALGFGLHAGWAVEGALGSIYKIDLSYLSPDVDMCSRLEGLTKKYKKPLLFTNSIFNLMTSESLMRLCRRIDVVFVNSQISMEIYTVDFSVPYLTHRHRVSMIAGRGRGDNQLGLVMSDPDRLAALMNRYDSTKRGSKVNFEMYKDFDRIERTYEEILLDKNLTFLLGIDTKENRLVKRAFNGQFADALLDYLEGNWKVAIEKFEVFMEDFKLDGEKDGPAKALIKYMKEEKSAGQKFFEEGRICPDE